MQLSQRQRLMFLLFFLACIVILTLIDVWLDLEEAVVITHLLIEVGILASSITCIVFTFILLLKTEKKLKLTERVLKDQKVIAKSLNKKLDELSTGFVTSIENRFNSWQLSITEQEVGFLLIKGLSIRDIANIRNSTESTTRKHCVSIYKKAGLGNRSELASYFLEDLLAIYPHTANYRAQKP